MKQYDLLAMRLVDAFEMYVAAVAGIKAMTQGAGLTGTNPSVKNTIERMRESFVVEARATMLRYQIDHQVDDVEELGGRADTRMEKVMREVGDIAKQVATKANRELAIGGGNLADAMTGKTQALGELLQRRMARPKFEVKDTAGRSWEAKKLLRTVVRDFAYQTSIDADFAEAVRADVKTVHVSDGTTIELNEGWAQKRDEVFHINSKKEVSDAPVQA